MSRQPRPAQLVSLPTIARMVGRPRRTIYRHLMALLLRDREEGRDSKWIVSVGHGTQRRRVRVNLSALRRAHPALFEQRYVGRDEFDSLQERVDSLEEKSETEKLRLTALIVRVKKVEAA